MQNYLKTTALTLSLALFGVIPAQANDNKQVWGGGSPDASFYSGEYVPFVIETLNGVRLSGYSWAGKSQGTTQNAQMVTENPTHLAVGQHDVLKSLQKSNEYNFTILHENLGYECAYLVTKNENYSTFGHVLANSWDITIGTGGEKSGSFATLQNLQTLFPDLETAKIEHSGGMNDIVDDVVSGDTTFGFFIMRPDPQSSIFEKIAENELTMVPVVDFNLEDQYQIKKLKIENGGLFGSSQYHTTACTTVSLITGDVDNVSDPRNKRRLEETIKRVGSLDSEKLRKKMVERTSSWGDFLDNIKSVTAEKTRNLMEASKNAVDNARKNLSN